MNHGIYDGSWQSDWIAEDWWRNGNSFSGLVLDTYGTWASLHRFGMECKFILSGG